MFKGVSGFSWASAVFNFAINLIYRKEMKRVVVEKIFFFHKTLGEINKEQRTAWSLTAPSNLLRTKSEIRHLSIKSVWWSMKNWNLKIILYFDKRLFLVRFILPNKKNKTKQKTIRNSLAYFSNNSFWCVVGSELNISEIFISSLSFCNIFIYYLYFNIFLL